MRGPRGICVESYRKGELSRAVSVSGLVALLDGHTSGLSADAFESTFDSYFKMLEEVDSNRRGAPPPRLASPEPSGGAAPPGQPPTPGKGRRRERSGTPSSHGMHIRFSVPLTPTWNAHDSHASQVNFSRMACFKEVCM